MAQEHDKESEKKDAIRRKKKREEKERKDTLPALPSAQKSK